MKAYYLYTVFVLSLMALGGCATPPTPVPVRVDHNSPLLDSFGSTEAVRQSSLEHFEALLKWWGGNHSDAELARVVSAAGDKYLPLTLACLSKNGVVMGGDTHQNSEDEVEENRARAAAVFMILKNQGMPAMPDLLEIMQDRRCWNGRGFVANALSFIGPGASGSIPSAMTDLTRTNTAVRQQGLIVLGGVGGRSPEAVKSLIIYTCSDSELLQGTAVWGLKRIMEAKDSDPAIAEAARAHLESLAGRYGEGGYVCHAAYVALTWHPNYDGRVRAGNLLLVDPMLNRHPDPEERVRGN